MTRLGRLPPELRNDAGACCAWKMLDAAGLVFVGALNQKALAWLAQQRECFAGRQVVVGCSGSFSTELMLLQKGVATAGIHGNDVALFSYILGEYLCGRRAEVTPRADAPARLHKNWTSSIAGGPRANHRRKTYDDFAAHAAHPRREH